MALAIGLAQPERAVRFSLVGDTWEERRARLFRVRYRIRQAGYVWHDCYHVEPNPEGTGYHAHMWQHGDYTPQRVLQTLCRREGMGIPYIERMHHQTLSVGYGLKSVRYGLKGVDDEAYLEANGRRLVHASQGFWRDAELRPISRIRGAVREARRIAYGPSEGRWILRREAA